MENPDGLDTTAEFEGLSKSHTKEALHLRCFMGRHCTLKFDNTRREEN